MIQFLFLPFPFLPSVKTDPECDLVQPGYKETRILQCVQIL